MKSRKRHIPSGGHSSSSSPAVGGPPSAEHAGPSPSNAALASELSERQAGDQTEGESGFLFDAISSWFRSLFDSEHDTTSESDRESTVDTPTLDEVVDEQLDVDGPEHDEVVEEVLAETVASPTPELAAEPPEGIARATSIRTGQTGAVLGSSDTHDVRSAPGTDAAVASTLRDGTPVTVLSVDGASVEVQWTVGEDTRTGWIASSVFSPQPRLNKKDDGAGYTFQRFDSEADDHSTETRGSDLSGEDVSQGGIANCFFIAAMNAVGNANGEFLRDAITLDESTGLYTVRFYERSGFDPVKNEVTYRIHTEVVDGMLPTREDGELAYARVEGPSAWGPIYEKAYAQWIGGYDKMGSGGMSGTAMTALTGKPSVPTSTSTLDDDGILEFFERAKASGTAVVCGSLDSMTSDEQSPLTATGQTTTETSEDGETTRTAFEGPYEGTLSMPGERQNIKAGTVELTDKGGNVRSAKDSGRYGDKRSDLVGSDVEEGEIVYDSKRMTVTFRDGKGPDTASDLEVAFNYRGLLSSSLKIFAWHAYVFSDVIDGKIQLYNPWGSWQPEPMTPAEFKTYYSNMNSNQVPQSDASAEGA